MPYFIKIGQSIAETLPFFKDDGRPPSLIVWGIVGPPTESTWWSLSLWKIWL